MWNFARQISQKDDERNEYMKIIIKFICAAFGVTMLASGAVTSNAAPADPIAPDSNPHPTSTWSLNPTNGDWNTAANWHPISVPDLQSERAAFGPSSITNVSASAPVTVHDITFNPGASQFTINGTFTFTNGGIINNSGIVQTFNGSFSFLYGATAGSSLNVFNNTGRITMDARIRGSHTPSAGSATFVNNPGCYISLYKATADSPTFINPGGALAFFDSTAGNATIENGGGMAYGADGGVVEFFASAVTSGTIINEGGAVYGGHGALLVFRRSDSGSATIIANGGLGPSSGAKIVFETSSGGASRIEVFGNGNFDISHNGIRGAVRSATAGSIEGNGLIFLGANNLTVGGNDLNTTFAGVISDLGGIKHGTGGSVTKTGTGALTLSNANVYTGGTVITGGTLLVTNTEGSGTGSGAVEVTRGFSVAQARLPVK